MANVPARRRSLPNAPFHALRSTSVARRHDQGISPGDNIHLLFYHLAENHLWHLTLTTAPPLRVLQYACLAASDMFRPYFHAGCALQGLPLLVICGYQPYVYFLTNGRGMHEVSIICRSAVTGWVPFTQAHLMIAFLLAVPNELMIKTVRIGANQGSSHQVHLACGIKYGLLQLEGIPKVRHIHVVKRSSAEG